MKNYFCFLLLLCASISTTAQQRIKFHNPYISSPLFKYTDYLTANTIQANNNKSNSASTIIGSTLYDYQSNASMPRRVHNYTSGKVTCIWNGSMQDTNYSDRGTFVNHFDGTQWRTNPVARVENKIVGWSTLAVTTNAEHVIAEPNIISSNTGPGTAFDTSRTFTNLTYLRGPHAAASAQNIHVVMASAEPDSLTGFVAPIFYTRSTNGGQSFEPMTASFATAAGYDSSKHAGDVGPNAYSIDALGNTVAILVLGVTEDVVLLKSTNNGTTWTKTIIREFPIKKYKGGITDKNGDGVMDTVLGVTGDGSIVIDNNGGVHVMFSDLEMYKADTGELRIFNINRSDYMVYWNDLDKKIMEVPVLFDGNNDGVFNAGSNFFGDGKVRYGNSGYSLNPQLSVGISGTAWADRIFLTNVAVAENDTNILGVDFRSIYINGTPNKGNCWYGMYNITQTQNYENVYVSTASQIKLNGYIHLLWQQDFKPGNAVQKQHMFGQSEIINEEIDIKITSPCFGALETGINKLNLKIFPNPATNKVSVELNAHMETVAKLRIINLLGQTLLTQSVNINSTKNTCELNISTFEKGLYMILIETEEGRIAQKVMIE